MLTFQLGLSLHKCKNINHRVQPKTTIYQTESERHKREQDRTETQRLDDRMTLLAVEDQGI